MQGFLEATLNPRKSLGRKFPVELWECVFEHLPLEDIKTVRLVTRKWTTIAVPFLFTNLTIYQIDPMFGKC